MTRLLLVAFFLEIGIVLIVAPWSTWWDRNYFAQMAPSLHAFLTNDFVRGAVTGLGVINVMVALAEIWSMLTQPRGEGRPPSILPSTGMLPSHSRIEPAQKPES